MNKDDLRVKVRTDEKEPIHISNTGIGPNDFFGPTIFPAKLQKHGEIFEGGYSFFMKNIATGLTQGAIFSVLALIAYFYLPKQPLFMIPVMGLAFVAGIGFAAARIWTFVYTHLDRGTAALTSAGGSGWAASQKQDSALSDELKERYSD